MKHIYFLSTFFLFCILSCAKHDKNEFVYVGGKRVVFNATLNTDNTTKTSVDDSGKVYWSPNEEINIFFGNNSSKFTSQNTEKVTTTTFSGILPVIIGSSDGSIATTSVMGLYPYDNNATCDDGYITTTLSNNQIATDNSFTEKTFLTIAKSSIPNYNLSFFNVCGGLKFTVGTEGIKKAVFKGNNGEKIAGKIKIYFGDTEYPEAEIVEDEGETEIVLTSDNGLKAGTTYYIVVLPATFENGATMRLETDEQYAEKIYTESKEIKRSVWGNMGQVDNGLIWNSLE